MPKDGYWILLQDWTECSLKCGGGTSWQQFMCVPPKNGGKPCKGKSIRTKPCNTQKCPKASYLLKILGGKASEVAKPVFKVAPFSVRPQRFSKCLIKDSDAFIENMNKETNSKVKFPVRVVMNNQTVSVFQDDSYKNRIYTFLFENSIITTDTEFCCIKLQDSFKIIKLCGYESMCGDRIKNPWSKQWEKDYNFFKYQCKVGRERSLLTDEDEKGLEDDFNGKVGAAREDLIELKAETVRKKEKKSDQKKNEGKSFCCTKYWFTINSKGS